MHFSLWEEDLSLHFKVMLPEDQGQGFRSRDNLHQIQKVGCRPLQVLLDGNDPIKSWLSVVSLPPSLAHSLTLWIGVAAVKA